MLSTLRRPFTLLLLAVSSAILLSSVHAAVDSKQARDLDANLGGQTKSRLVKRFGPAPDLGSGGGRRDLLTRGAKQSADGIVTIPLLARGGPKDLGRRAFHDAGRDLAKRDPPLVPLSLDDANRFGATLTVAGTDQRFLIDIRNPVTAIINQKQVSSSVDLSTAEGATATGGTIEAPKGTEYSVPFELGSVKLDTIGVSYLDVSPDFEGEIANGFLGLGLKGAVDFSGEVLDKGATLPGVLEAFLQDGGKTVASPIVTLTIVNEDGELGLGGVPDTYTNPFYQSAAKPNLWNVVGKFDGVDFEADSTPFTIDGAIGTTEAVTAFFAKNKIEVRPATKEEYDYDCVVAPVDCGNPPDLAFEFPGGTVTLSGEAAAFQKTDKGCISVLRGQDQGDYPTGFTFGNLFIQQSGLILDYTGGNPQIGFVPS